MNRRLIALLSSLLFAQTSSAQWLQTPGPGHAAAQAVFPANGRLLLGVVRHGVYLSNDHGVTWQSTSGIDGGSVLCFASNANYVFAGLDDLNGPPGVYRSPDGGLTWQSARSGLPSGQISALLAAGDTIFAGVGYRGIYRSLDNGTSWSPANSGIQTEHIAAIVRSGATLIAAGSNYLYRSTNGRTWFLINNVFWAASGMAAFGPNIFAGGFQGLIRSTDGGQTWSSRIDVPFIGSIDRLTSFAYDGATLYASTISSPGSGGSGVVRSTDGGTTWQPASSGIERVGVQQVILDGTTLVAAAPDKGALLSPNGGASWTRSVEGIPYGGNVRVLANRAEILYAGAQGDGVYRSDDYGVSWSWISGDLSVTLGNETVFSLITEDSLLLAGTGHGVFRSTDDGASWSESNMGLPPTQVLGLALVRTGSNILLGTQDALYYSTNGGLSWNPSSLQNGDVGQVAAADGYAYANYISGIYSQDGIFRSTNNGVSWTRVFNSLDVSYMSDMEAEGPYVYAGIFVGGMLRSTNHGTNWQGVGALSGVPVYCLGIVGTEVLAGTDTPGQIYRSNDHGASWQAFGEGLPPEQAVGAVSGGASYLYAATEDEGVWRRLQPTAVGDAPSPRDGLRVAASPNPFRRTTAVRCALPHAATIDLRVLDIAGRTVATIAHGVYPAGPRTFAWDARDLLPGVYLLRLDAAGLHRTARVALIR
jgi:photosystem II stability/assembly factor-like uncharacterized protein